MKHLQRVLISLVSFFLIIHPKGPKKRANLFRKFHLFGSIGENCIIQGSKLPFDSNLIFLHDNVVIGPNVGFGTHDAIHIMLNNRKDADYNFVEKVGCIEVMDNVFIGSCTRILYNTRIGSNVIIGTCSVVTKDIPDNSVYAGVPARYVCSFDEYVERHKKYSEDFRKNYGIKEILKMDDKLAAQLYRDFKKKRDA